MNFARKWYLIMFTTSINDHVPKLSKILEGEERKTRH